MFYVLCNIIKKSILIIKVIAIVCGGGIVIFFCYVLQNVGHAPGLLNITKHKIINHLYSPVFAPF